MKVKCPGCGVSVYMPDDWDGDDICESLCNQCYETEEEEDAHRRNAPFCAKCGGECYFDEEGNRIVQNRGFPNDS